MTTRVVHRSHEPFDVLIDRTTPWGNPFSHQEGTLAHWVVDSRWHAVEAFKHWVLTSDDDEAQWIRDHVHELRGKTLGCWCAPRACHGRCLADLADGRLVVAQLSLDL